MTSKKSVCVCVREERESERDDYAHLTSPKKKWQEKNYPLRVSKQCFFFSLRLMEME